MKPRPTERVNGPPLTGGETAIPWELLTDRTVSSNAIRVYGIIRTYAPPGTELRGVAQWALAGLCNINSINTLKAALDELTARGFIEQTRARTYDPRAGSREASEWPITYRILPPPQ